jgi:hypothetical protein
MAEHIQLLEKSLAFVQDDLGPELALALLSPRLSSLSSVSTHRSPQYELNPSVFRAA